MTSTGMPLCSPMRTLPVSPGVLACMITPHQEAPTMISLSKITDPDMLSEARDWVTDALNVQGECYQARDVVKMVDRWYEGGVHGFLVDSAPLTGYATGEPLPGVHVAGPVTHLTRRTVIIRVDTVNDRRTSSTYLPHLSGAEVHLPRATTTLSYR